MIFFKKFVDLHIHTNFSDGTFSPEEVVAFALKNKLSAIAITDHDTVSGIENAIAASRNTGLEVIPGIEFSAEIENYEIHILGLFIDTNNPGFLEKLKKIRNSRLERMQKMIEKLNALGISVSIEEVLAHSGSDVSVGRLHLARVLFEKGNVSSVKEAFERFIGRTKPCYVKRMIISPKEAIAMIKEVKGIAVLAHPGSMAHDEIIPRLIEEGLQAIEAYHIEHNQGRTQHYLHLAKKYNLLISGGSDCHGIGKGFPLLGLVKVPYEVLERLKLAKIKIDK